MLTNLEVTKRFRFIFIQSYFVYLKPPFQMSSKTDANKQYYRANKPYPIRLGELKMKLQIEAFETDRSLHGVLKDIVKEYFDRKEMSKSIKEILEPLSKLK